MDRLRSYVTAPAAANDVLCWYGMVYATWFVLPAAVLFLWSLVQYTRGPERRTGCHRAVKSSLCYCAHQDVQK